MYQNNIAERSSSRVLQRPGGHQSINIFGGDDAPPADDSQQQRTGSRGGRRVQKEITANVGAVVEQPKPSFTPHTSTIASVFNDNVAPSQPAAVAPLQAPFASDSKGSAAQPAAAAAPRVNNIWGGDDGVQRSSTRVLRGPGGGSSGVAGALGGAGGEPEPRKTGVYRGNQTSANSPFSTEPEPQRSSTRVKNAPGGGGNGNILSWGH